MGSLSVTIDAVTRYVIAFSAEGKFVDDRWGLQGEHSISSLDGTDIPVTEGTDYRDSLLGEELCNRIVVTRTTRYTRDDPRSGGFQAGDHWTLTRRVCDEHSKPEIEFYDGP